MRNRFKHESITVKYISQEQLDQIIQNYENPDTYGLYVCKVRKPDFIEKNYPNKYNNLQSIFEYKYIGIDNSTGDCFMEIFTNEKDAILYASGQHNDSVGLGFDIQENDSCTIKDVLYEK